MHLARTVPATARDRDPVQVGDGRPRLRGRRVVKLSHNDLDGAYGDNRGGYLVKITKRRRGC